MSVSIKMKPISVIKARLGIQSGGSIHKFFTNACYKHMDKYVPKREGNLRKIISIDTDSITYESHYAQYQYKGQRNDGSRKVRHYTTPGTGPYWDKRMWSAEKDDVTREVQNFVDRGGK